MFVCKDILDTKIDPIGIKVMWRDESNVVIDNGTKDVFNILFSYGNSIFQLSYIDKELRDKIYYKLLELI